MNLFFQNNLLATQSHVFATEVVGQLQLVDVAFLHDKLLLASHSVLLKQLAVYVFNTAYKIQYTSLKLVQQMIYI